MQPEIEEYVVVDGDTLWDICDRFLGRPELWPKLWAFNHEISNPHWIYPGDLIRFYRPIEALPSLADIADSPSQERMLGDGVEEINTVAVVGETPAVEMVDGATRGAGLRRGPTKVKRDVFLTPKPLSDAGRIENAETPRTMLVKGDEVVLSLADASPPEVGSRFIIFNTAGAVDAPTGDEDGIFGYLTRVTGVLEITASASDDIRARIVSASDVVERGQLVTPMVQSLELELTAVAGPSPAVKGAVVAVGADQRAISGDSAVVFIDRGTEHAIGRGNRLSVQSGDEDNAEIGTLIVIDAQQTASACLVLRASREIRAGDHVATF